MLRMLIVVLEFPIDAGKNASLYIPPDLKQTFLFHTLINEIICHYFNFKLCIYLNNALKYVRGFHILTYTTGKRYLLYIERSKN
jgi:hypothetical protein